MRFPVLFAATVLATLSAAAAAQRHDGGSSPPTAPPPKPAVVVQPIAPLGSGLGALQFFATNYAVSAPQSLTRQLQSGDERIRTAALAAIGAPAQYLAHGHVAVPHSVHLDFLALGSTDELDAILTVELDQHLLSAILLPENEEWHRVATVLYPTAFTDSSSTPSTFLRTDRSLLDPLRYTAIFHATALGANGGFTESEAHVRVLNGKAVVTLSFISAERACDGAREKPCEVIERWLQADATDAGHRFLLVTATGRLKTNDTGDPIATAETYETAHLRTFSCQPLTFSETALHFEPTANPTPCIAPQGPPAAALARPGASHSN
jgi:hypothetical protein